MAQVSLIFKLGSIQAAFKGSLIYKYTEEALKGKRDILDTDILLILSYII